MGTNDDISFDRCADGGCGVWRNLSGGYDRILQNEVRKACHAEVDFERDWMVSLGGELGW